MTRIIPRCSAWPAVVLMMLCGLAQGDHTILVEAEHFDNYGGWVLDQQFMDQMGSPYLLAHGLGAPVKDAATEVTFPATGEYRIWVRTRDWVAPWKKADTTVNKRAVGTPGKFQLLIDEGVVETVFGTEGDSWNWQAGGPVEITKSSVTLKLHDLTGFEGRCDAIVFSDSATFTPPSRNPEMAKWRRKMLNLTQNPQEIGEFDLVVGGGGMAGACAAISAARLGLKVALIQDRPVIGGNNSSEVRVHLMGTTNHEPFPQVGEIVKELDPGHTGNREAAPEYGDDKKLALVRTEKNISLFLNCRVNEVETEEDKIVAVIAQHTKSGKRLRFVGRNFADCTGDGCVGHLAGADYEITGKGHLGFSDLWRIVDTGSATGFPRCPWALDLSDRPLPGNLGGWIWESGFGHDPIEQGEYIRDWNFRAMYGAWDALKNTHKRYPTHKLKWAAYIAGKRESRRLLGDVILTGDDLRNGVVYEDGCVPTTWTIDLHYPDERYSDGFEGDAFVSRADQAAFPRPYWVPYRCLYSRNIANLFMAGRDISVTHEALGTVRVMRTTGMMGEIVGIAAAICKEHNVAPRAVYAEYLDELKRLMSRPSSVRNLEKD